MNCYVHPEKEAVGTCVSCGKFICSECVTEIQGKNYCKHCVDELFAQKNQEINQAKQQTNTSQPAPMVFMNAGGGGAAASSSSSSSSGGGYRRAAPPYPTNSVLVHIILFLFTAGLGNIIYFLYIKSQQNKWNALYR